MAPQRLLIHSYKTKLGLPRVEFFDCDGKICLIQDSLLGAEPAIRLGSTTGCAQLSQEMAATLIPLLQRFVGTGSIGDD